MNTTLSEMNSAMLSAKFPSYAQDVYSYNIENQSSSSPLSPLSDSWILPIVILCVFGILCTIITSFCFICLSHRRLNGHFLLTHLFICFGVCFVYIIIILFLIRANELFCGLREFLSQLAYALLYSALLCRFIMQWLGSRILSKRTKQFASLLIYLLLVFIQIPIGVLWWYFTIPRICQQGDMNILESKSNIPKFIIDIRKPTVDSQKSCSNSCIVDYRFYATFTYAMLELAFCTIISTCLFLYHHCHKNGTENDKDKTISINGNNRTLTFLNMFAFLLIDFIWLSWSFTYYFTHPFFIFPSLIIGMFLIATICLLFILFPQIYYYSKLKINDTNSYKSSINHIQPATLYSNRLASSNDTNDNELLLEEHLSNQKLDDEPLEQEQHILSNTSELSDELGTSGTYLPITRTPKGPFKVKNQGKKLHNEKADRSIHEKNLNTQNLLMNHSESNQSQTKGNEPVSNMTNAKEQGLQSSTVPIQRPPTSNSVTSDFVTPVITNNLIHRTNSYKNATLINQSPSSMLCSVYPSPHRDETLIPILCDSERPRTSTPVQMRMLANSASSSVPLTRRIYSGTDLRYIQYPYQHSYHPPPPPPTTPPYYSPQPQQYLFVDPYRTMRSCTGTNLWHPNLLQSGSTLYRYTCGNRRYPMDYRSLSQRLWDIDSGDDENETEEDIVKIAGRATPSKEFVYDYRSSHLENENHLQLNVGEDHIKRDDDGYLYEKRFHDV